MNERAARLGALSERQENAASLMGVTSGDTVFGGVADTIALSSDCSVQLHYFNYEANSLSEIETISTLNEFDESVFAKWRSADLPVLFVSGFLGTLSSALLRDYFAEMHDDWSKKKAPAGGHAGEDADWVPGNKQPGGFGHRWQHGHDLANPFEVNWEQYRELAEQSGTSLPVWLKAVLYWLRHLFQDSFSKEGLPVPFHSLLRKWLAPARNREILQMLGTIKARDCVGTGLTNAAMTGYLWGTEKSLSRVFAEPNYRAFSLMTGANMANLFFGLCAPAPYTSLNWSTIPIIGHYSWQLMKLERKIQAHLIERENILSKNDSSIMESLTAIRENDSLIATMGDQLSGFEKDVDEYHRLAMASHAALKDRILRGDG